MLKNYFQLCLLTIQDQELNLGLLCLGLNARNRGIINLQRLFWLSSLLQSAVSVHLRRNIGMTAVVFSKELDPVQKIFMDKIREYKTKRQSYEGPVDTGPECQQELDWELSKLKQMHGKADMKTFPYFTFEEPKFKVIDKPQS
ncbi:ATP synthase-coupling factor 6, mitochondrial-like [Sorex araneus]|uniref:ATP synthase-coupling factor 6, mitochondrial-like n=1 Tax=Sorex araneus TaxID=42254 RepID=UPI0024339B44|nr:ATP synthase-coupling factor 6, mitochondrial-like [Sorex araneus]